MTERPNFLEHPDFIRRIEQGTPLPLLEVRLKPEGAAPTGNDTFYDYSKQGFLGHKENLLEVIKGDFAVIQENETSHSEIADALTILIDKGYKNMNQGNFSPIELANGYEFLIPNALTAGEQSCPWECGDSGQNAGTIVKIDATPNERMRAQLSQMPFSLEEQIDLIKDDPLFDELFTALTKIKADSPLSVPTYAPITGLLPHLVDTHLFFEGKQSPYRADPQILIDALDLRKNR